MAKARVRESADDGIHPSLHRLAFIIMGFFPALSFAQSTPFMADYDSIFSTYAEFCAVSKIKSLNSSGGGAYGHAAMYLKGACRDTESEYPRIKPCDHGGVGLSVNNYFRNINWIAVDGKEFFFTGGLSPERTLTSEVAESVIASAIRKGYLKNVQLHDEVMAEKEPRDSVEHFIGMQTIGTDYAMNFGRNVYCVRLPVTKSMMRKIVDHYNSVNEYYYVGKREYRWLQTANNCTHTPFNALAAASFWKPKNNKDAWFLTLGSTPLPVNPYNLAVPFNVLTETIAASNDGELPTVEQIYENPAAAKALVEEDGGWLLNQPGALVEQFGIHRDNKLYDTNSAFKAVESSIIASGNPYEMFNRQFSHKRYGDLKANFEYFRAKILRAQAHMKKYDRFYHSRDARGRWNKGNPYSLKTLFDRYEAYLDRQLKFVNRHLASAE